MRDSRALREHSFTLFGSGTTDPNAFKWGGKREEKETEWGKEKKRGSGRGWHKDT